MQKIKLPVDKVFCLDVESEGRESTEGEIEERKSKKFEVWKLLKVKIVQPSTDQDLSRSKRGMQIRVGRYDSNK
jgi:hypothetical protein